MPQPITHYLVIKNALRNTKKDVWKEFANVAGFGSFGPDLFYMKDIGYFGLFGYSYMEISDIMHWEGSLDIYCAFMDYIKKECANDRNKLAKLLAFAYGYYSHVITDLVFHPWVYRFSGDHWLHHWDIDDPGDNKDNYLEHKRLEAAIDCYLVRMLEAKDPYKFKYHDLIRCYQDDNDKTLDHDIFVMFNACLRTAYEKKITKKKYPKYLKEDNYNDYFSMADIYNDEHPIHESYDDFVDTITELYTIKLLNHIPIPALQALIPRKRLKPAEEKVNLNMQNAEWKGCNEEHIISYSAKELYQLALRATEQCVIDSDAFLASPMILKAKSFFKKYAVLPYLKDDYNLDSGLKSSYNSNPKNKADSNSRFEFAIDKLHELYLSIPV